ncbi:hypothetical protein ETD86_48040 [Nonomuraea turkmeniaca]|uniref:Ig-like domain-containing protein n=1 Tax=Nonomuraea turkmeniaca TaxID=103838 RepID=A0A5S4EXU0_9ACTN|nr:hypothetical protein [Nonomuraea turkmeniaca]TMR08388.1 hypothetical protein ETD86_48040 [Nonomuraea turkmeniaca]
MKHWNRNPTPRWLTRLVLVAVAAAATTLGAGAAASAVNSGATASSAGPYLHVGCESWTRLKIRCTATTIGAWDPHTVRWYVNDVLYSTIENVYGDPSHISSVSVTFACSPSQPKIYSAVVTDDLGRVAYAPGSGAACRTGNP